MYKLIVSAGLFLSLSLAADTVYLKDGRKLEGRVVMKTDTEIVFQITHGTIKMTQKIKRSEIEKIVRGPDTAGEFKKRLERLKENDIEGMKDLIEWCRENELERHADDLQKKLDKLMIEFWREANIDNLCEACNGYKYIPCERCGGEGRIKEVCRKCNGEGQYTYHCNSCCGSSVVSRTTTYDRGHTRVVGHDQYGNPVVETVRTPSHTTTYVTQNTPGKVVCPKCKGSGEITKRTRIVTNTGGSRTGYKTQTCPQCRGQGTITCPDCRGLGGRKVKCRECNGRGHELVDCPLCHGEGHKPCPECKGTGLKDPTREVNVEDLFM